MKNIILFITTFSTLIISGYSQPKTQDPKNIQLDEMNQYLLKAKSQKTAARICLSAGSVLFATGLVIGTGKAMNETYGAIFGITETHQDYTGESILMFIGGAGMVTSIPLFIASGSNKQKARVMLANQKTIGLVRGASKKIPGITLTISL